MRLRDFTASVVTASILLVCGPVDARSSGPRRTQAIDMVVIHSTGGPTCDASTGRPVWVKAGTLAEDIRLIEAHPKLGIHYMIDRDGTVRRSVPEDQIAYHVFGYSARSIAIELVNDGDGVDAFPEAQLRAAATLVRDIAQRRGVTRQDPGSAFPFEAVLDAAYGSK
jgi:N-acetyl-anhydromuramyl-L-alanine amidase AmpD